jgi:hypothetical protein
MITFLLIISFILHAISFLSIILFYFRLERMRDIERKQATIMKDMEDLLSSYVLEMKEENGRLLEYVKKGRSNQLATSSLPSVKQRNNTPEFKEAINTVEAQLTEEDLAAILPRYDEEFEVNIIEDNKERKEQSFEILPISEQAKLLHENGLSIEEIAKKLNKGKTEIELFIKFNG